MPPKRKRASENDDEATESKRYAHLKPQVRRVPEKTIKAKWTTLPEPVQDKVRDLFHSLERPVIMRNKNEQKRIEAQSAVQAVVRNLGKRLPRMPFPPITKDSNFDYESALNEHRGLEAKLSTMNDSIDLLKSEIAKEEALLASEKKALQEMDKNAKRADAERKRQMKKEHPVLRQLDNPKEAQDGQSSEFTLADAKNSQINLDDLDDDPEVQVLMKQLHGHLQSMQSNMAPLTGLRDALTRSQAALDLFSND
ncbi:CENP-A-nucleosome distal centromere subunit CENP-Q [Penicillium cosmopolitanum]|uniref:CENP-A-nucleosome distal centromere subunit CENP-Q n=1 Tax=Penicillium cosmopolitanum TaxID=1131564 RepID=A0A9X0BCN9_9EURO|nr:CENP-A-nucleosome distal centromere subunit CENP-Q [Penicillium cosmopolitanum]KAJ5407761.1 CENP-A-nucleosome distal centromere subunit CENP-Q [Penicillium cosmopolitanum]